MVEAIEERPLIDKGILDELRTRLIAGDCHLYYFQQTSHMDSVDSRLEHVSIFVGPYAPLYEVVQLQTLVDGITIGIKKTWESKAKEAPLGLSLARAQFIEEVDGKKQIITVVVLPHARYAKISADFYQGWQDKVYKYVPELAGLSMLIEKDIVVRFRDKEEEFETWAKSLFQR